MDENLNGPGSRLYGFQTLAGCYASDEAWPKGFFRGLASSTATSARSNRFCGTAGSHGQKMTND